MFTWTTLWWWVHWCVGNFWNKKMMCHSATSYILCTRRSAPRRIHLKMVSSNGEECTSIIVAAALSWGRWQLTSGLVIFESIKGLMVEFFQTFNFLTDLQLHIELLWLCTNQVADSGPQKTACRKLPQASSEVLCSPNATPYIFPKCLKL